MLDRDKLKSKLNQLIQDNYDEYHEKRNKYFENCFFDVHRVFFEVVPFMIRKGTLLYNSDILQILAHFNIYDIDYSIDDIGTHIAEDGTQFSIIQIQTTNWGGLDLRNISKDWSGIDQLDDICKHGILKYLRGLGRKIEMNNFDSDCDWSIHHSSELFDFFKENVNWAPHYMPVSMNYQEFLKWEEYKKIESPI